MSSTLDFFRSNPDFAFVFGMFAVLFAVIGFANFRQVAKVLARYRSLPDMTGYLAANPSCKTSGGPVCYVCHSNHFGTRAVHSHFGFANTHIGRVHYCTKCQNDLYRT